MFWTLRIAISYGAIGGLSLLRRVSHPWARVCVQDSDYKVVLSPTATNGRELCLMVLCYYPRLRAFLEGDGPLRQIRQRAFDELLLQVIGQLQSGSSALALQQRPELHSLLQRAELPTNSELPHSYHVELFRNLFGRGVAPMLPDKLPSASLLFHYVELLRVVASGVSSQNRLNLLTSLRESVSFTRSLENPDSGNAIGLCFRHGVSVFLRRWSQSSEPDTHFHTPEALGAASSAPLRRMGFYSRIWIKLLAVGAYPFSYYCVGGRLPDIFALALAVNASVWVLAGVLTAQGVAWFKGESYATSALVGNAIWRHGTTFRKVSTVFLYLALFVFIGAPWHYGRAFALVAMVFVGSTACEMLGYTIFARLISRCWLTQLGRENEVQPNTPLRTRRLSYLPLYMSLSNFGVFIPYAIAMILLVGVLKMSSANWLVITASIAIVGPGVRFGVPALFKGYARRRTPLFNAILLRKFLNESQSRMLRHVVSPAIGAYGTLLTLSDPSYEEGRERMIGPQEAADSVKDELAQVDRTLKSTDLKWMDAVHDGISASDLVIVDVTQITPSLSWEIAEALTLRDSKCLLLVCSLEGYTPEKLSLAKAVLEGIEAEIRLRGESGRGLDQRFREVLPPLVYTTFPSSLIFRIRLVNRLSAFLAVRQSTGPGDRPMAARTVGHE